uniref:Exocyst complex component 5 n=1 Tax=Rhabditophanes sp. KR3021 TaxID=114890 RepID=A0AC35TJQ8_9BILA
MAGQQYFATYVQDLEQEPFDVTDFVERLAWRINGSSDEFDAVNLKNKFEEEIGSLQLLSDQFQGKINVKDAELKHVKQQYMLSLQEAHERNATILDKLKRVEGTMAEVSTKVVHLGDQLETVHATRAKAFDALQLIKHFNEFVADQPLASNIFTDPERLLESAQIIHKLSSIAQELDKDKFGKIQQRISNKYSEIEEMMIDEFMKSTEVKHLREITDILIEFQRYNDLLDKFVDQVQTSAARGNSVFNDILDMCKKKAGVIEQIFPNPASVMSKLILNAYNRRLEEEVHMKLKHLKGVDDEQYLSSLQDLYSRTLRLNEELQQLKHKPDGQFVNLITSNLFNFYLKTYIVDEETYFNEQCNNILQRFYESKGHQKRNLTTGGLQELKRDLNARLRNVENFGDETFLSEEVAINILQEIRNAFSRSKTLCPSNKKVEVMKNLYELLVKYLYREHVLYAIELIISSIPISEPKTEPASNFFPVVQKASTITHLFVKQFDDSILPLLEDRTVQQECESAKNGTLRNLETRINVGLEKQINAITGYIRYTLSTEQKKTDFKPDEESSNSNISVTFTCNIICSYLSKMYAVVKDSLDGANLTTVLTEVGIRVYRMLFAHIHNFSYSINGSILLLCDINEYRRTVATWKISEVNEHMETLHALVNLLVVVPGNLEQAFNSPLLAEYDRETLFTILLLRHDAKNIAIVKLINSIMK